MKSKFKALGHQDRDEKFRILTCLPDKWSLREIQQEFGATFHEARLSKELAIKKGVLSVPDPFKPKNLLDSAVLKDVGEFYKSDDNSQMCPGKNDFKIVRDSQNKKLYVQKKMLLMSLKESYQEFKKIYKNHKIGFTKFCSLKPPEIVVLGSSGTHATCVCIYCQNFKMLIDALKKLDVELLYKNVILMALCQEPTEICYSRHCTDCPGLEPIKKFLLAVFEKLDIEKIEHLQWLSTDRYQLESLSKSTDDFLEFFLHSLEHLIPHFYAAKLQASFMKNLRESLKDGEFLVTIDFAENYAFSLQNEVQGFHSNRPQATVHPSVIYYKHDGEIKNINLVGISENTKHDFNSVYIATKNINKYLHENFENVNKLFYFSDGAGSQYKNKYNFKNVCMHKTDFGVDAEWNFYASCHGKGPCDGIGGTVKGSAYRDNLGRNCEEQIRNAKQLFDYCVGKFQNIHFYWYSTQDYLEVKELLKTRMVGVKTIQSTQKFHSFIPENESSMRVKYFSIASESYVKNLN